MDEKARTDEANEEGTRPRRVDDRLERHHKLFEVITAVLLSVAVLGSAFCAYQATRWSGLMSINFAKANTARVESSKAQTVAVQETAYDASTFLQLAITGLEGDEELALDLGKRFIRDEFQPYVERWLALDPFARKEAPLTPFDLPDYENEQEEEARVLTARAERLFQEALEDNQTGDNYVLATVFFAVVLFAAGISSKFPSFTIRTTLLVVACGGIIAAFIRMLTLPFA